MAIFCPACPQPGLNLPSDWKQKYSSYVFTLSPTFWYDIRIYSNELIRTFIMDGNFSAEHMRYRTTDKDVALSPGMAFMSNPDIYKSHLQSGAEMRQASIKLNFIRLYLIPYMQDSTCNTYKAIEQANSSRPHLDITGIGATACCHGFFVPTSVVDFQKGEKYI